MRAVRVLAAFVLVLTAVGIAGCDVSGNDSPLMAADFHGPMVRKLPGGGKVAVGSPDGHRIQIQWRDRGASGWSEPTTIERDDERWTHKFELAITRRTVAVDIGWFDEREVESTGEELSPDVTAQVICPDRDCLEAHRPFDDGSGFTTLAADGRFAVFAGRGEDLLLWSPEKGFRVRPVIGRPSGWTHFAVGPDDRFSLLRSVRAGDACRYLLYSSPPQDPTFPATPVARTAVISQEAVYHHCDRAIGPLVSGNDVSFELDQIPRPITFRRDGDRWEVIQPDAGLERYPDTNGVRTLPTTIFGTAGVRVAIGSPDGKQIFAQVQKGDGSWSPARRLATAPAGLTCGRQQGESIGTGMATMVICYPEDTPGSAVPDVVSGFGLATPDGDKWTVLPIERPFYAPIFGGPGNAILFPGARQTVLLQDLTRARTLPLPVTEAAQVAFTADEKGLLVITGNADPAQRCRPTWRYLALAGGRPTEARPIEMTQPKWRLPKRCYPELFMSQLGLRVGIGTLNAHTVFLAERNGSSWTFRIIG